MYHVLCYNIINYRCLIYLAVGVLVGFVHVLVWCVGLDPRGVGSVNWLVELGWVKKNWPLSNSVLYLAKFWKKYVHFIFEVGLHDILVLSYDQLQAASS